MNKNFEEILKNLKKYNYPQKCELDYVNEFTFLVAIILSAQSKDKVVNVHTKALFEIAKTPQEMVLLGIENLKKHINKIGLYNKKAEYIIEMSNELLLLQKQDLQKWYNAFLSNYKGNGEDVFLYNGIVSKEGVPAFKLGLMQLKGIGRKGANVFLNEIYKARTFPVDTHVTRLSQRLGLSNSKNVLKIEQDLEKLAAKNENQLSNMLVYHGRNVCTAIKPNCENCLLKEYCFFFNKNISK